LRAAENNNLHAKQLPEAADKGIHRRAECAHLVYMIFAVAIPALDPRCSL